MLVVFWLVEISDFFPTLLGRMGDHLGKPSPLPVRSSVNPVYPAGSSVNILKISVWLGVDMIRKLRTSLTKENRGTDVNCHTITKCFGPD